MLLAAESHFSASSISYDFKLPAFDQVYHIGIISLIHQNLVDGIIFDGERIDELVLYVILTKVSQKWQF